MSRRLAEVFSRAKSTNRAALIGYLPAGYPTAAASVELMNTMIDAGVDAIEVGLPYSDPLMDGADIQFAVAAALAGGTTTDVVLDVVGRLDGEVVLEPDRAVWRCEIRGAVSRGRGQRGNHPRLNAGGGGPVVRRDLG